MAKRSGGRRCGGRATQRGEHQADAGAPDERPGEVGPGVVGRGADAGDPPRRTGGEEQAAHGPDGALAVPGTEQAAGEGAQSGQERSRGQHEPGAQDRLVPHPGEEQHGPEHHGAEAGEEDQRAHIGQGHRPVPDHGRLDDRVGVRARAQHQPHRRADGDGKGDQDGRAHPAPVGPLHDGGHQAGHGERQQSGPDQVRLVGVGVLHLPQHAEADDESEEGEGEVHQEDPAPADLDQEATDGRAKGGRRATDGRPQADGRTLAFGPEGGEEQAERGGQHEGAAAGLENAGGDEQAEGRAQRAEGGRRGEDAQPDEEGPLATGPVGPATGRDEQGGEHDGVGAEHPRQRAQALAVEIQRDAGKGDVDDEEIQRGEEHPGEHHQGGQGRMRRRRGAGGAVLQLSGLCHRTDCTTGVALCNVFGGKRVRLGEC